MRKVLIIAAAALATACSGSINTAQASESAAVASADEQRSYDLSGFERISVVGPHRVTVSVGPAFSIRAEGPGKTFERTEVVVEDGELKIHPLDDDRWEREEWRNYEGATFTVTLPRLEGATMVGSGLISVDRIDGDAFAGSVAGSGDLEIAALSVNRANLSVAGSGDLLARGKARRADVSIAGSGNLRGHDLASDDASISVAGSGNVELTVNGGADVSVVGSGNVEVAGTARCTVSRIGSGNVDCADTVRETEISFR
jgi:hypothetical protein